MRRSKFTFSIYYDFIAIINIYLTYSLKIHMYLKVVFALLLVSFWFWLEGSIQNRQISTSLYHIKKYCASKQIDGARVKFSLRARATRYTKKLPQSLSIFHLYDFVHQAIAFARSCTIEKERDSFCSNIFPRVVTGSRSFAQFWSTRLNKILSPLRNKTVAEFFRKGRTGSTRAVSRSNLSFDRAEWSRSERFQEELRANPALLSV